MLNRKSKKTSDEIIKPINDFKGMLSPDFVVGNIIKLNENVVVVPVLKTTVGYLGGGGEYGEIKLFCKEDSLPFAGGTGTILNMSPCGFLVLNNGVISFVKVDSDIADKVFDKTSEIIYNAMGKK